MIDESPAPVCSATATGIILCLRMLAQEAAELQLGSTLSALQRAIQTCEEEHSTLSGSLAWVH